MPRNYCCNPFGRHRKQIRKDLRPVTCAATSTGLVQEGDFLCSNCCKSVLERLKPEEDKMDQNQPSGDLLVAANVDLPSTSGITSTASASCQYDGVEMLSSADESTTDASSENELVEGEDSYACSILNQTLPALGESPIKLGQMKEGQKVLKIRNKMRVVQKSLEASYGTKLPEGDTTDTTQRFVCAVCVLNCSRSVLYAIINSFLFFTGSKAF